MKIVNERIVIQRSELTISHDFTALGNTVRKKLTNQGEPIRFIIVSSSDTEYVCEVDVLCGEDKWLTSQYNIFGFEPRGYENHDQFNITFCVPTGIGAELGGHCGDANSTVRLFASICDNLITHPNCVNGANYNEQPGNTLYIEGSTFTNLFMGRIGLQKVKNNKILLLVDKHKNHYFNDEIVNAVSTARVMLGVKCDVHIMENVMSSKSTFTDSGRASGEVNDVDRLFGEISRYFIGYDAIALSTHISTPVDYYDAYFVQNNMGVNPWGSVEAMITHSVSWRYSRPCAHAPLVSEEAYESCNFCGIVDPRKAPESESIADIYCCLKGLQRSPRILHHEYKGNGLTSDDISCLVVPHGCVGLPVLAAFAEGIPVIAVRDNTSLMRNRYSDYNFPDKVLYEVANYWEALGVCQALRCGVDPNTVRRPLGATIRF